MIVADASRKSDEVGQITSLPGQIGDLPHNPRR